jgi:hypothetical protein
MGKLRNDAAPSQRLNLDLVRSVSQAAPDVRQAMSHAQPQHQPEPAAAPKERLTRTRRVLFTPSESKHHDRIIAALGDEVGLDALTWSQVTRALWRIVEGDFDPHIPISGISLKVPPSTDLDGVKRFDRELASYIYQRIILGRA